MSEAFRKVYYIIRLFYTNKLSKSIKIYKLKSTSQLPWDYLNCYFLILTVQINKVNGSINKMTQKKRQSINLKNDRIRTEYDGIYHNAKKVTFR